MNEKDNLFDEDFEEMPQEPEEDLGNLADESMDEVTPITPEEIWKELEEEGLLAEDASDIEEKIKAYPLTEEEAFPANDGGGRWEVLYSADGVKWSDVKEDRHVFCKKRLVYDNGIAGPWSGLTKIE